MKRDVATVVSVEECTYLRDHGVLDLADKRTKAIVRQHVAGDSRFSTLAIDCYLQGVRDAVQAMP